MIGSLVCLGLVASSLSVSAGAQERGRDAAAPRGPQPQVVLSAAADTLPLCDYGLGDGGVSSSRDGLRLRARGEAVTPGGVEVACRAVGVKLSFPSGCELLVAPDGGLHLRSGEVAGPFPAGVELLLGDGSRVQVSLVSGGKRRLRAVSIVDGDQCLQLWRRGQAAARSARPSHWAGVRLSCCGGGGDVYRPIAVGALVTLERVLVRDDRRDVTPPERLVLLTQPLLESLQRLPRQHRDTAQRVRSAVAAVAAVAERGQAVFQHGSGLHRVRRDRARWSLAGGFELQLALEGPLWPRLQLFAGRSISPLVEWTVGSAGAVYLSNPNPAQLGKRWHGNGTRMPRVVPGLQAREHLEERRRAIGVLRRVERARG